MIPLTIIPPLTVTPTMLTATDVTEADYSAWSVGTTYALGDRVIVVADHAVYESLAAGNVGNTPSASPTKWIKVGPTNRWKAFDLRTSSATTKTTSMYFTIVPGQVVNAVAALGLVALTVRVVMVDGTDGTVYDKTVSLTGSIGAPDWYTYFYDGLRQDTSAIFTDLPAYGSASITVTITNTTGQTASCASLLVGFQRKFGIGVEAGASVGITDYSVRQTDDWGNQTLIQRAYSRRLQMNTMIYASETAAMQATLESLRATPALWIGHPRVTPTAVLGFLKDWDIGITYPTYSEVQMTIEGMT